MMIKSFLKASLLAGGMLTFHVATAQELYVYTEPASNMPAKSVSVKLSGKFLKNADRNYIQRYTPEIMYGASRKWMVHIAPTFSDMYSSNLRWESVRLYAKYRFFSADEVHQHFRMAAFSEISYSRNEPMFDELSFEGDQSGIQGGVILTQLWKKLAVSSTLSLLKTTLNESKLDAMGNPHEGFNYSLSAGYLVLPVNYTSFKQTNFNIYTELLGQRGLDRKKYFIDLAPAIQLIFNSNAKLNFGYRFQLSGNMHRMAEKGWLVAFERTFLRK